MTTRGQRTRRVAGILLIGSALLGSPARGADSGGWTEITVGEWRTTSQAFRGGMVLGAMNTVASMGVVCQTPISANMIEATLQGTGPHAAAPTMGFALAVAQAMGQIGRCQLPAREGA